jgi:outer membrane protein TolC
VGPSIAKAQQRATDDNVAVAGVTLVNDVTSQYLTVLRSAALVGVADEQVTRNQQFLTLAQIRFQVGQATQIDVTQAQVALTTAQVTVLQARQSQTLAKIELLRRMGVPSTADVDSVQLTEAFPLTEPHYDLDALRNTAHQSNPSLHVLGDDADAARLGVRQARMSYWPSFQISTGFNGFTQQFTNEDILLGPVLAGAQGTAANCVFQNELISRLTSPLPTANGGIIPDCNAYAGLNSTGTALDPNTVAAIKKSNEVFPFSFANQPWSIQLGISLPIWDGFSRALRVSQAHLQADNAYENQRAQTLVTDATIQQALVTVQTDWRTMQIQDTNRTAARLQLQLAQDRYRVGSGTALDVSDAQNQVTQAEASYVESVFDYHLAVVALETAVGHPLH